MPRSLPSSKLPLVSPHVHMHSGESVLTSIYLTATRSSTLSTWSVRSPDQPWGRSAGQAAALSPREGRRTGTCRRRADMSKRSFSRGRSTCSSTTRPTAASRATSTPRAASSSSTATPLTSTTRRTRPRSPGASRAPTTSSSRPVSSPPRRRPVLTSRVAPRRSSSRRRRLTRRCTSAVSFSTSVPQFCHR